MMNYPSLRGGSLALPPAHECRTQSLIASIDGFLRAVDRMSGTIMIPSMLRDVELSRRRPDDVTGRNSDASDSVVTLDNSHGSIFDTNERVLARGNSHGSVLDTNENGVARNIDTNTDGRANLDTNVIVPTSAGGGSIDWNNYHHVYRLLQVARYELISGTSSETNELDDHTDENESEQSRRLVLVFRHHLEGLFDLLQLLTSAANHVSKTYLDELDVNGTH